MHYNGYEIKDYNPAYVAEVSEVQKYLYGISKDITLKYFQWKYEQNPHSFIKKPLGKIAIWDGKIIGFRGFFPTKWYLDNEEKNIFMLSSSDVCVHPEHRKKGLFQKMTEEAIKDYSDYGYKFYINLSSNQFSAPGDIKMGWRKIGIRKTLRRCNVLSLLKYLMIVKFGFKLNSFNAEWGNFGGIEVSDQPKPVEIHNFHIQQNKNKKQLYFSRDIDFIKWKYRNNLRKYLFFYYNDGSILKSYIVIGIRRYTPRFTNKAEIIDFAWSDDESFESLLKFLIRKFPNNIFDLWNYNGNQHCLSIFKRQKFSENSYAVKKQESYQGKRYCLIRPVNQDYTEKDWFVDGIDLRNPENLEIKEISVDDS